jgi:eukaryotic translation initiation factor 2C
LLFPTKQLNFQRNNNLEITAMASTRILEDRIHPDMKDRTNFNADPSAKKVTIPVNFYKVNKFPDSIIYVYDVVMGDGTLKRPLLKKLWNSRAFQKELGKDHAFIWDGNKLAWSLADIAEIRVLVDLDAEEGKVKRAGHDDKHRLVIKRVATINLEVMSQYLKRRAPFSSDVLMANTFFDHLIAESPSKRFLAIKNAYYDLNMERKALGGGVEAMKGIYQSLRISQGPKLTLNVDVANTAFWVTQDLLKTALAIMGAREARDLVQKLNHPDAKIRKANKANLELLKRVRFYCTHRGETGKSKTFSVNGFTESNAKDTKIETKDAATGIVKRISVFEYFKLKYNKTLVDWALPLVTTMKKDIVFPIEVCHIAPGQRFPYKLDDQQIQGMLAFASTSPQIRQQAIKAGVERFSWATDPVLKKYGLEINSQMIRTDARMLAPPVIEFGPGPNGKPQTMVPQNGRWDLRNKKFAESAKEPLRRWGVMCLGDQKRMDIAKVRAFIDTFMRTYRGHNGNIDLQSKPVILHSGIHTNAELISRKLYTDVETKFGGVPQLLFFITQNKQPIPYNPIKRQCDIEHDVPSQFVLWKHVMQAKEQYCSNVAMKVNAKLGGITSKLSGAAALTPKDSTIFIGADVSHAPAGTKALRPSMAAITASLDPQGTYFTSICRTNGFRVEMISQENMEYIIPALIRKYRHRNGTAPTTIMYFRDGVSEGQYAQVINEELASIKSAIGKHLPPTYRPNFVVTVCSKRHHTRFFPDSNETKNPRHGNPKPGLLVERDCTHPVETDFYLVAHDSPLGTARPIHYHMLYNNANFNLNRFHKLVNDYCSAYARATCSVSLFPAVYYAHLASKRAAAHLPEDISEHSGTASASAIAPQLLEMKDRLTERMWFI